MVGLLYGSKLINFYNSAYVFKNYKEAYKLLKYIGYDGKLHHCFKETSRKDNWNSLSKFPDRKTFGISIVIQ